MVWPRYIAYFVGISLLTWLLTQLEISFPGALKMHIMNPGDQFGTSEFSPIEIIQPIIIAVCGALMLWVAEYCPSQRPIAIPFGGLALAFMIRELDYFLDRFLIDNLWQGLIGFPAAFVIVYTYLSRKRLKIAWVRIWPSPGLALLFAGAVILFAVVRLVGHEPLWMSLLGEFSIWPLAVAVTLIPSLPFTRVVVFGLAALLSITLYETMRVWWWDTLQPLALHAIAIPLVFGLPLLVGIRD